MQEQHTEKGKTDFSLTSTRGQLNGMTVLIGPVQIRLGGTMILQRNAQPGISSLFHTGFFFFPRGNEVVCL